MPENLLPKAVPGTYQATLTVGGAEYTQPVVVDPDPRLPWTQEDLIEQRDLKLAMRSKITEIHESVNRIRSTKDQIEGVIGRDSASSEIKEQGQKLIDDLTEIEGQLVNLDPNGRKRGATAVVEKLKTLAAMIDEGDSAPTQQMHNVYQTVSEETAGSLEGLSSIYRNDVTAFNEKVSESGMAPVG